MNQAAQVSAPAAKQDSNCTGAVWGQPCMHTAPAAS